MKHAAIVGLFGLALAVARPASAICPYPQPQYATCEEGECHGSFTFHYCAWYSQDPDTCGGYCSPDVTCCGIVVDKEKVSCGSLCVGCQPGAKVARETPKKGKSTKGAPSNHSAATRKATTPLAEKASAPVVSGRGALGQ